jgi:phenylacetic acid degradation operon negative regulatory protein
MRIAPVRPPVASSLARALAQLDRPIRAWSLIVTIFGDAIVPRGGSLWLGTLNDIMGGFGIREGVVRTAISRLAADDWVVRTRRGRNSYYRLSDKAGAQTHAAAERIYRLPRNDWSGAWKLAVIRDNTKSGRARHRALLRRQGFGQLGSDLFIAPGGTFNEAGSLSSDFHFTAKALGCGQDEQIVSAAWPLARVSAAYRAFLDVFTPFAYEGRDSRWHQLDDLVLRILVVHELRRIVLRDPDLPLALLGKDWPGGEARLLAAQLWRESLVGSEKWLDLNARAADGPLPKPAEALQHRFER